MQDRHRADMPRRGKATQARFVKVDHIDLQHEINNLCQPCQQQCCENLRSDCVGQANLACLSPTPLQAAYHSGVMFVFDQPSTRGK
jgi:hypothetical protein